MKKRRQLSALSCQQKEKSWVFFLIFSVFFWLIAGAVGLAQEPEEPFPPTPPKGKAPFERLRLSADQKEKMQKIVKHSRPRMEKIRNSVESIRREMADLLNADEPDRKKVETLLSRLLELERERQNIMLGDFFEMRKMLTPEQRRIFSRMVGRMLTQPPPPPRCKSGHQEEEKRPGPPAEP